MFTINDLMKRTDLRTGNSFTIDTGDGPVCITPCVEFDRKGDAYVAFWLMDAVGINLCGSDKAEDVVNTINNLAQLKKESDDEKEMLRKFYDEHIKGKSYHGLDSYELYCYGQELWSEALKNGSKIHYLYDFTRTEAFLKAASEKFGAKPEHIADAMELSEHWSTYSDWHKDLYGYRPR